MTNYLTPLTHFGVLKASGDQIADFLQGQLTCDVRPLTHGQSSLAACCDHKGRMLANFWLVAWQQGYYLLLPSDMVELTLTHLKKFAVFSKVELNDVSDCWQVLELDGKPEALSHLDRDKIAITSLPGPTPRQIILSKQVIDSDLPALNQDQWQHKNIQAGLTYLTPKTSGLFTPQMINLEKLGGVSFDKGCYVGQEVIARTQHLGKLKRHLYQMQADTPQTPEPGDPLVNDNQETIGIVTTACSPNKDQSVFLAVIQDRACEQAIYLKNTKPCNIATC